MLSWQFASFVYPFHPTLIKAAFSYLCFHELKAFVRIRQDELTSESYRNTVRATTILVTSVPANFLNVETLKQVFSVYPGGVRNVFLNRDCSVLLDEIDERDHIAKLLESAETELIIKANKKHRKAMEKAEKKAKKDAARNGEDVPPVLPEDEDDEDEDEYQNLIDKYIPKKKRPTYRIPIFSWMPSLPLIGKKVLSFHYS
jgi:calcium permeable stress-gated cation channel